MSLVSILLAMAGIATLSVPLFVDAVSLIANSDRFSGCEFDALLAKQYGRGNALLLIAIFVEIVQK